jgi:hypothetical protein
MSLLFTQEGSMNPYNHAVTSFISQVVKIETHLHALDSAYDFTSLGSLTIYHGGAFKKPLLIPLFIRHRCQPCRQAVVTIFISLSHLYYSTHL